MNDSELVTFTAESQASPPIYQGASPPFPSGQNEHIAISQHSTISLKDDKLLDEVVPMTSGAKALYACIFVVLGTSQLFYWNSLLNVLGDVMKVYYPDNSRLSDYLTAIYNTFNFASCFILTWRGSLNFTINYIAGISLLLAHVFTPVFIAHVSGNPSIVLFCVVSAVSGTACGLWQSGHFALASSMPEVMAGWVSAGNGMSGIVTFALWMLFSEGVLRKDTFRCLWWTMGVGSFFCLIAILATVVISRKPDVQKNLAKQRAHLIAERSNPDKITYWQCFKLIWPYAFGVFLVFFGTLLVYPAIGPFRWNVNGSTQSNVLVGIFQVGDFIGRFAPQLKFIPYSLLPIKTLPYAVVGRYIFVAIFIAMWRKPDQAGFNNFGFQFVWMLFFAVTNGWVGTSILVHGPQSIDQPAHRARGSTINLLGLLLGIVAGVWMAKVVTIGS